MWKDVGNIPVCHALPALLWDGWSHVAVSLPAAESKIKKLKGH